MSVVVGIGNPDRGDDGIGPLVAARVAELGLPDVEVITQAEPLQLLGLLDRPGALVVIDAVSPRGTPGRVSVSAVEDLFPGASGSGGGGTHGFGVLETVALARALGGLNARVVVVGIEATTVIPGAPLSDAVRDSVEDAAQAAGRAATSAGSVATSRGHQGLGATRAGGPENVS